VNKVAILVDHLTVNYGSQCVLRDLSLEVPVGTIFGFLGRNGAGKTTTIKTLLGIRRPTAGKVEVLGYDVVRQHIEVCSHVGYVSETHNLYDYLNITQMCAFCRDTSRRWKQNIVDTYLDLFALPRTQKIKQFSKGMKTQLALSLAMGSEPDILILDEPTADLDPIARELFLHTLIGDIAAAGKTVFFSSHILSDIEAVADHVAVIEGGRIVLSAELDELRETHKILRLTYPEGLPPAELEYLQSLPHVSQAKQEGQVVQLHTTGMVNELVSLIKERLYPPHDIETLHTDLGSVLLEYIKGIRNDH